MKTHEDHIAHVAASLAIRLSQAISVARLHDLQNAALDGPVEDLRAAIALVIGSQGTASIKCDHDAGLLFLNGRILRAKRQAAGALKRLEKTLASLGAGEVIFQRPLGAPQVRALLGAVKTALTVNLAQTAADALRKLLAAIDAAGLRELVSALSIEQAAARAVGRSIQVGELEAVRLAYARTLSLLRELLRHAGDEELRRYFWRKLLRAVQGIQSLAARASRELLALTSVKDQDDPALVHAVDTCILAILVARRIELPKQQIAPLGLAALLHGIGKSAIDAAILAKPDAQRTPDEARLYAKHPYRALGALFESRRVDDAFLTCALAVFQYDARDGVPETRTPIEEIHPLARIVAVCEAYDALTSPLGGRAAQKPDEALALLLQGQPRPFDLTVLGVVANMLGFYPPRTAVLLDSGAVGVVIHPNESDLHRPVIAVLKDAKGNAVEGAVLDLSARDAEGRHRHSIVRSVHLADVGVHAG